MNNLLQDIKYKRMKHEERFLVDILNKVKIIKYDDHPDSDFYILDNRVLFEQDSKNNCFNVSYYEIWSVFELEYGIGKLEIEKLIRDIVWKTLKIKISKPLAI